MRTKALGIHRACERATAQSKPLGGGGSRRFISGVRMALSSRILRSSATGSRKAGSVSVQQGGAVAAAHEATTRVRRAVGSEGSGVPQESWRPGTGRRNRPHRPLRDWACKPSASEVTSGSEGRSGALFAGTDACATARGSERSHRCRRLGRRWSAGQLCLRAPRACPRCSRPGHRACRPLSDRRGRF